MRAVIQRVRSASVKVDGELISEIGNGLLLFLGISRDDNENAIDYLTTKIANLRFFRDDDGKMNRSVLEIGGEILVVSQFTLYGDCRKGRRPSFVQAAPPDLANRLYEKFMTKLRSHGVTVKGGVFQAMMDVELINDGPVTLLIDSTKIF